MDISGFVTLEYWIKFDKYPLSLRKERLGKNGRRKTRASMIWFLSDIPTLVMTSFFVTFLNAMSTASDWRLWS